MRRGWMIAIMILAGGIFLAPSAGAQSLQIRPTIYQNITLGAGEKKKGFVDISNPTAQAQIVDLDVQAFRQTDDAGSLAFYDDAQVKAGVQLDLSQVELGGHEAIRVYFLLDGTKLPNGDVFAAIFAQTAPSSGAAAQSVRVGTLLALTNGTPAPHRADITNLNAAPFQMGEAVTATMSVTNPAKNGEATGFFPEITVDLQPYSSKKVTGPLVFAGRTRTIDYRQAGNYFGIVRLQATAGGNGQARLIFVMTGYWRWLAPLIVAVGIAVLALLGRHRGVRPRQRAQKS